MMAHIGLERIMDFVSLERILHLLLHLLAGAATLSWFIDGRTVGKRIWIILIGACLGITPDVTKLFGDVYLHSMLFAPFIGLFYGFILWMWPRTRFFYAVFASTMTVIIGHLLVDFLGNGDALFYPIIVREQVFSILSPVENLITLFLLVSLVVSFLFTSNRKPMTITLLPVLILLIALASSHGAIRYQLYAEYKDKHPDITVFSSQPFHWKFYVRLEDHRIIHGRADYYKIIDKRVMKHDR